MAKLAAGTGMKLPDQAAQALSQSGGQANSVASVAAAAYSAMQQQQQQHQQMVNKLILLFLSLVDKTKTIKNQFNGKTSFLEKN
jgi:hypothetical protein